MKIPQKLHSYARVWNHSQKTVISSPMLETNDEQMQLQYHWVMMDYNSDGRINPLAAQTNPFASFIFLHFDFTSSILRYLFIYCLIDKGMFIFWFVFILISFIIYLIFFFKLKKYLDTSDGFEFCSRWDFFGGKWKFLGTWILNIFFYTKKKFFNKNRTNIKKNLIIDFFLYFTGRTALERTTSLHV